MEKAEMLKEFNETLLKQNIANFSAYFLEAIKIVDFDEQKGLVVMEVD
jgi:hypothetical protein